MRRAVGVGLVALVGCVGVAPSGPHALPSSEQAAPPSSTPIVPDDVAPFEPQALPTRAFVDLEALRRQRWNEPVAGWVALADGATMHASREAATVSKAPVAPIPTLATGVGRDDGGGGLLLKVVADHGDVVEVQTVPHAADHCGRRRVPPVLSRFELRVFVRKRDLLLVVAEVVKVVYPDGTGVAVAQGVGVGQPEVPLHGEAAVAAEGFAIELAIAPDHVALAYQPGALAAPRTPEGFRLPGATFSLRGRPFWRGGPYYGAYEESGETDQGVVLHLGGECLGLWVLGAEGLVEEDRSGGGMLGIGGLGRHDRDDEMRTVRRGYAKKGAPIRWADGRPAGTILERHRVFDGEAPADLCVETPGLVLDRAICIPPDSVEVVEEKERVWRR